MRPTPSIPGYELLEPLGGGPMTAVFAARDLADDSPCAVKVVRDGWEDQATAVKLLHREARAGLSVRHPHLVRVTHAHVTRPPYFLVMELLRGESLRQRLRRDYRLEPAEAVWVARQTAEALAALHRAGFLHGDVKPDNLRLVPGGPAVLLDLGFAHRPGENAAFLREGYVLGTADYLAPELCDPEPAEDLSSDWFSLGVLLFEMLTGRLPYPRGSVKQTFRRHRCDPPADVRRFAGPLPTPLLALSSACWRAAPRTGRGPGFVVRQLIGLEIAGMRRRSA